MKRTEKCAITMVLFFHLLLASYATGIYNLSSFQVPSTKDVKIIFTLDNWGYPGGEVDILINGIQNPSLTFNQGNQSAWGEGVFNYDILWHAGEDVDNVVETYSISAQYRTDYDASAH